MKQPEETAVQTLTFEDMLLSEKAPSGVKTGHSPTTPTAQIGSITGLTHEGHPLVTWPGAADPEQALTQIAIKADMIGKQCTLLFVGGDTKQPVILGLLHDNTSNHGYEIIQGEEALILQCGAARIELHDNGRIILQGMQIDSQAYGPYRIKGASVKVN